MARRAPAASAARQRAAFEHLQASAAAVTEIQIELAEIPAPSGAEEQRAAAVAHWLRSAGCRVDRDSAGNVIALRAGGSGGRRIALSSHLDTVFPAEQAVRVARGGGACRYCRADPVPAEELHGPGIADDAAGLAALIALAQALAAAEAESAGDLLFIATVGEEGRGNLRGARHLFQEQSAGALDAFVTIDHPDPAAVVHRGIGSRRFAVHFHGPGGHAWGDFGRYNPAYALAATAQRLASMALPSEERCTLNVGVMEAGRSVNAIPEHARMEVDLRSEAAAALDTLEAALRAAVAEGQAEELTKRPSDRAWVEIEPIGERPPGVTAPEHPLVRAAIAALEAEGFRPTLTGSSTDANAAMAAAVPAIALGWGGRSGNLHSAQEHFSPKGRERTLAVLLRLALGLSDARRGAW